MKNIINIALTLSILYSGNLFELGVLEYNNRAIGSTGLLASNIHIDKAINLFEENLQNNNEDIEQTVIYLLKSYYFKGEYATKDINSKKRIFDKGKKIAEDYISIYPKSAAIRYWYLVNLGSWAESYGTLKAAREGVADIMKEQSERIIKLDSDYKNGGGYFMLGAVHLKSPYIPFFLSWPDKNKAVKYLQLAVDTKGATFVQKKYLADALYKTGLKDKAINILNEVINSQPSKDDIIEDLNDINKAKELLETF
tara:strand:- start:59 stop:820 length:762 start_codon:yes stop_codon:yes gene_type:complete